MYAQGTDSCSSARTYRSYDMLSSVESESWERSEERRLSGFMIWQQQIFVVIVKDN
jgi:hypothetical protein